MTDRDKDMTVRAEGQPLFSEDAEIQFIYKKIETITGALFLVTNLIPDTDILKKTLREHVLSALAQAVSLANSSATVVILEDLAAKLSHIHSLLDVSFWSGVISQMNSSLLQKEITATQKTVFTVINRYKAKFYIDSKFFMNQPLSAPNPVPHVSAASAQDNKGHDKGQHIKDNEVKSDRPIRPIQAERTGEKNDRRELIIAFLKDKQVAGIKDLVALLPAYSEKTVQRELAALVSEGVLRKQGERRWSTYSLA